MSKSIELKSLVGEKHNRLTVLKQVKSVYNKRRWECLCVCGNKTESTTGDLRGGHKKSCGCLLRETRSKNSTIHGYCGTRLHGVWRGMRQRCNNPNNPGYKNYGGRGVKISPEWKTMKKFGKWALENGYKEYLTIDRIDNDGDYSPENCRWATVKKQANNRRSNRWIEFEGETRTIYDWSKKTGIGHKLLAYRIEAGWPMEDVFNKQRNFRKK